MMTKELTVNYKVFIFLLLLKMVIPEGILSQESSWGDVQNKDEKWYTSKEAKRIADNVLVYQHHNGGWYKNLNITDELSASEKQNLKDKKSKNMGTTIDNGATYSQLKYLAKMYNATKQEKYKASFLNGIDFLLAAQYENGGWPQYYPLKKGYYEHITYNDGAMIGVMNLLREIAKNSPIYAFVDTTRKDKAKQAIQKGLQAILETQVEVDGKLTIWCAQHDKDNFKPAKARAYELPALSGKESVGIVNYLIKLENPSADVKQSIRSAVDWFENHKITGKKVVWIKDSTYVDGRDRVVVPDSTGVVLWGRFNEIETGKPIFVGRDGIIKYDFSEIEQERRTGYNYIDNYAEKLLKRDYPKWEEKN